nr:MAG TPA: hypothetical protein [Bacteriophage sp.]
MIFALCFFLSSETERAGRTAYFGVRVPGYHFGQKKILKGST